MGQFVGFVGRRLLVAGAVTVDLTVFFLMAVGARVRRGGLRELIGYSPLVLQLVRLGIDALPVVGILALFTGFVVIYPMVALTDVVGAQYVTDVLVDVVGMELCPLITATVLVSRSGSAIAVELANMKLHGELDSLEQLGVDINHYALAPRLLAASLSQLSLAVYFTLLALGGGVVLGGLMLSSTHYSHLSTLVGAFTPTEVLVFAVKNLLFGLLIGAAACFYGLQVQSSPNEVPRKMQSAVISSLLLVFLTDALFAGLSG